MTYATNLAGVDFTRVDASGAPTWTVGQVAYAANGDEYMYVKDTGSTFAAGQAVAVAPSGEASLLTNANAKTAAAIGWCLGAVTAGQYHWVQLSGRTVSVRVKNGCLPAVTLYTTATAGALDDSAGAGSSLTAIQGVRLQAGETATSSNASYSAIVDRGGAHAARVFTSPTA